MAFHLQFSVYLLSVGFPPLIDDAPATCWISTCRLQCLGCLLHFQQTFTMSSSSWLSTTTYDVYATCWIISCSIQSFLYMLNFHLPFTLCLLPFGFPAVVYSMLSMFSISKCHLGYGCCNLVFHLLFTMCLLCVGYPPAVQKISASYWNSKCSSGSMG